MKFFYQANRLLIHITFNVLLLLGVTETASAQCPLNIDFERGNFFGWTCYTGTVQQNTGIVPNWFLSGPVNNQHTMLTSFPGDGFDYYGGFPQNCPNGSGHSIRLGNSGTQNGAERVKYTFTVPVGQNQFSLTYYYAIVLQDLTTHTDAQKPKFKIDVINVTDGNTTNPCSSFDFNSNGSLPGFFVSPYSPSGTFVRCKDWSAASINLNNNAGKTFDIIFSTQDCAQGGHFGYAYVDINSQCSSSFVGAAYCAQDTAIDVTAPYGFQSYKWFNNTFTQVLGYSQLLHLSPPPPPGTNIAVQLIPYNGYGCQDTLYADLLDTLHVTANAGRDTFVCNNSVVIGSTPRVGLAYHWTPTIGLSNPDIANPVATPSATTQYIVTASSLGGGCTQKDTVIVGAKAIDNSIQVIGGNSTCQSAGSSPILQVQPIDSIQWFRDGIPIIGANQPQYTVVQTGVYHAVLFNNFGCSQATADQSLAVYPKPVAGFTINTLQQCFSGNQFNFTNTSTVASGNPLLYNWQFGDASIANTGDAIHAYTLPGTYPVKMIVTADGGCTDSSTVNVTVYPSPDTSVTLTGSLSYCAGAGQTILKVNPAASIQWYKDNVAIAGANQTQYTVTQSGAYYALIKSSDNCSLASAVRQITIYPKPVAGFNVNTANQCFTGNQFNFTNTSTLSSGNPLLYSWDLGDAGTAATGDVTHNYLQPGLYNVKLLVTGDGGCVDSSKMNVTVYPNPDTSLTLTGSASYCEGNGQSIIKVNPAATIQWYKDNAIIAGAVQPQYNVTQTGSYNAVITTSNGCTLPTSAKQITIYAQPKAGFTVNNANQCFTGHQFVFTNTSIISSGTMQYHWDLGDGTVSTTADVTHTYSGPGVYIVKMLVNSAGGCADSSSMTLNVYANPAAAFTVQSACVNLQVPITNQTINNSNSTVNYLWDFGNGQTSTAFNPVYAYPAPGSYNLKLTVSTVQCPFATNAKLEVVAIGDPQPGVVYQVQNAILNFPLILQARNFGGTVTWSPGINLDRADIYKPTFRGFNDQLYTIAIKDPIGCVTVDTQFVKTYKKIDIFVPNVFTPGNDGKNDLLRPLLMSFKEVHYFRIFNRWGQLLFEMKSDRPGWDGTVKGIPQDAQTVVWMIEAVDVDGIVHQKQGTTLLMR
ncbi:MAG: PKD domain-containing protein [Ferruginibacter sp.]